MNPPRPMRGTGNLVQDLIVSTSVLVERCNLPPQTSTIYTKPEPLSVSPNKSSISCSICSTNQGELRALTLQEMGILQKFVLSRHLDDFASTSTFTLICAPCSTTLLKLTQLFERIEHIVASLWTAIRFKGRDASHPPRLANDNHSKSSDDANVSEHSATANASLSPETGQNLHNLIEDDDQDIKMEVYHHSQDPSPVKMEPEFELEDVEQTGSGSENDTEDRPGDPDLETKTAPTSKTFHCETCILYFTTKVGLANHLLTSLHKLGVQSRKPNPTDTALFSCPFCHEEDFADLRALKKHHILCSKKKPIKISFPCNPCGKTMGNLKNYNKHLKTKSHLKIGQRDLDGNQDGEFPCDECPTAFDDLKHLVDHKASLHQNQGSLRCDPCEKTFKKVRLYKEHLLTNSHLDKVGGELATIMKQKRDFKCEDCKTAYSTEPMLQAHLRGVHTKPNFVCEICAQKCRSHYALVKHQRTHSDTDVIREKFIDPQDKPYPCKLCEKRFRRSDTRTLHVKSCHEGVRFSCDLCPKSYSWQKLLLQHKQTAHPSSSKETVPKLKKVKTKAQLQCDLCPTTRIGMTSLRCHSELKHYPEKTSCPYGCPDTTFTTEQEWKTHLEQCQSEKLTDASKCRCFHCGSLFRTNLLRISHHLSLHKSYSCEFCPVKCTSAFNLEIHTKEHKESRPFLCVKCGKRYRSIHDFNLHSKIVCGDDEDAKRKLMVKRKEQHKIFRDKAKAHKCNECSKMFVDEARLEKHKNEVHG